MQQTEQKHVRRIEFFPDLDLVLLGLLASLTVQSFRVSAHELPIAVGIEALVLMTLPLLLFWRMHSNSTHLPKTNGLNQVAQQSTIYHLQAGAFLMVVLCLVAQWILRRCGLGDANEIVALLGVSYVAWYLIIFSNVGTFARSGFLLACSLVLFVCFTADSTAAFVCAFLFAMLALWRLLGNYWSRINSKALDGRSETLSVNGIALLITMLVVSFTGLIVWSVLPSGSVIYANGFAAFSGGTDGRQDPYAFKGVGDGNMLAAGENATTTGAVDSDQFIEDHKPSMYDMISETYNGPVKIRKELNRAVALNAKAKHIDNVVKSEQAGKSFRTVREPPDGGTRKLENRISKALFYVEGSVPARFTMDCYHEFDGWDWSKATLAANDRAKSPIKLKTIHGKPWYVVDSPIREYLSVQREHRVKIMRLSSKTLPACSTIARWHIHRVNLLDLFDWNDQGIISIDSSEIPSQTMIDVLSHVPNFDTLRSIQQLPAGPAKTDSPFAQMPENETSKTLKKLVGEITQTRRRDWNQVDAIVSYFRNNFLLDPQLVASDQGEDSIESFLKNGGGPSYLFASATTQALRAAGFRTRLASGFLVRREDFDRKANQSIVTGENLHMWPEVSLDGWHWLPVEPTPGYPTPYSHRTVWQIAKSAAVGFFNMVVGNPIASLLAAVLATLAIRFWGDIKAAMSWALWSVLLTIRPSRQLSATRKMLDTRFRAAGIPRPSHATISDWFLRIDRDASRDFFNFWQLANFSAQPASFQKHKITSACRQASSDLSFRKIKNFVNQMTEKETQC